MMKHLYLDILIFIFLFFVICLAVLFYVPGQKSSQKTTPHTSTNTLGVSLFFSPNPTLLTLNTPATVNLMINTNGKSVSSIQAELVFDPASITNVNITKPDEPFFPEGTYNITLSDVRYANGRISYAVDLKPGIAPKSGQGKIATISFESAPQHAINFTEISFVGQSSVLSAESNESILSNTDPLIIQFTTPLNPLTGQ